MTVSNIFSSTLLQKTTSMGLKVCGVPLAFQVKQSAKMMVWGAMTGRRLTKLHMLPTGKKTLLWVLHRQTLYSQSWLARNSLYLDPIKNTGVSLTTQHLKTMKELKRQLRFVWKNLTSDTLKKLAHSMPRCLENVVTNKSERSGS